MGWPGEQLLSKLWETLAEKGVGSLLKPRQMRREGLVGLELDRARLLSFAQTERDVEDIRSGKKDISDFSMSLKFAEISKEKSVSLERAEPVVNILDALEISKLNSMSDSVRREINTAGSIICAEEALCEDGEAAPDTNVNDDWLYRWRDYTGEVSDADLQKIWGRILAGEVKAPGTYSLRTLDFLRNLSQEEAALIAKIASVVINGFVWRREDKVYPCTVRDMLHLQEMGILIGVDSVGIHYTLSKHLDGGGGWVSALTSFDRCVIVRGGNNTFENPVQIPVVPVSALGLQIIGLGDFKSDLANLEKFAGCLTSYGYKVSIAEIAPSPPGKMNWVNEVAVN